MVTFTPAISLIISVMHFKKYGPTGQTALNPWVKTGFKNTFWMLLLGLSLASCGKKPEQVKFVPSDAQFVAALNGKSMVLKAVDLKSILKGIFSEDKKEKSGADSISSKIENSGIDFLNTTYLFTRKPAGALNTEMYFIVPLSSPEKWAETVKGLYPKLSVTEAGGLKQLVSPTYTYVWNEHLLFTAFSTDRTTSVPAERVLAVANLKEENSLLKTDSLFNKLSGGSADISFWVDLGAARKSVADNPALAAVPNISDSYLTTVINFEKGEVLSESHVYISKMEGAAIPAFDKTSLGSTAFGQVPSAKPLALAGIRFDPGMVKDQVKKQGGMEELDAYTNMLGFSGEELIDMLSGEITLALLGGTVDKPDYYGEIGLRNPETFKKIATSFVQQGLLIDVKTYKYSPLFPSLQIIPKPERLILVSGEALRDKVLAGKFDKVPSETTDKLKEGSAAFYIDFKTWDQSNFAEENMNPVAVGTLAYLQDLSITSLRASDTEWLIKGRLGFINTDQNSLKTVLEAVSKASKENIPGTETDKKIQGIDSAAANPLP